jgi:perosamine synthetase
MPSEVVNSADNFVPLCVPSIRGNEWKYIKECLDTNWVSSVGSFVDRFEKMVVDYVGAKYAVATINGTAALHVALIVAGVQPNDEVLVSTLSFIAPANAVRYVGGWPVFIDADPQYWQMDPQKVADFLEKQCKWQDGKLYNKITRRRVSAILPVHILGHPVDMDPILEIARRRDLVVIEDATESLGSKYKEQMVGQLGDIACFSFNGNKIITTGGGGMIVTEREAWADKARYLTTQAKDEPVEFIHDEIGYNYRLTNIQAAMGCAQMEQLNQYISAKREITATYTQMFSGVVGLDPAREAPWAQSNSWMFTALVDESKFGMSRRDLMHRLQAANVETRPLWQPLHLSPAHRGSAATSCEMAVRIQQNALSLPCSVGLTESDQKRVMECILPPR